MDKTAEDLKVRTKRFAIAVLDFVDTLPRTPSGDAIARQLARSGLGVAGNYRSSCRARSHTEFTARLGVVLEEADESELWLEICEDRKMGEPKQRPRLLDESGNFVRSSRRAARRRESASTASDRNCRSAESQNCRK